MEQQKIDINNISFLSCSMTTMLDYQLTLRYLAYLGFEGDTTTAIKVTRPRKIDRRKGKVQRNVFLCYVFGAPRSGKVGAFFLLEFHSIIQYRYVLMC